MKTIRSILPLALIVLAPMVMLYPLWSNPVSAGEDDIIYYYPLRKMVGQALREGRLPLYNELEATGTPLMADPQSAVLHPATWLFAAIDAKLAFSLSIFLAFSLAGGGAFVYLRRLGLSRPAATFGATAFMFCGFMVGHRVHLSMIHTACWLPWCLWCIENMRAGRRWQAMCWLAPIGFLAITAGHWPTLIQMSIVVAAYLLLRGRPLAKTLLFAGAAMLLAAAMAWPQVQQTAELLGQTTRQRIGYAMAGENSFFPASGVLAFFPMLMGSRTPNFFPQSWWGPWHLCETLGYVGLATLALAAAGWWRLRRKDPIALPYRPLVRTWTWLGLGAGVWMLGYYLPTYRLVHMLPVLGVIRCPSRLIVVVDLALATLAAFAVDAMIRSRSPDGLAKTVRRVTAIILPLTMLAVLGAIAAAGALLLGVWPDKIEFFTGGARDMLAAVRPDNPAVWVPIGMVVLTGLVVRWWLARPKRRAAILVALLLADLFLVTRFVDAPPAGQNAPDPERSPAAAWLAKNAGLAGSYRVWGLAEGYHDRPSELLLAKTAPSLGVASIGNYGPFQSPAHAGLLGFRIFGTCRDWPRLIRQNHLLSAYSVRYILAAAPKYRSLIESVRVGVDAPRPDGPDVLGDDWTFQRVGRAGDALQLRTPVLWSWSMASQPVSIESGKVYRISLDARGPDGGAANFLRAEIFQLFVDGSYRQDDSFGLTVHSEQIGETWKHYEWTFRSPDLPADETRFRMFTMSERPIWVRNISLRPSDWPQPAGVAGRLAPGEPVYRLRALLPAENRGDPPVAIYENMLCRNDVQVVRDWDEADLESLKWPADPSAALANTVPDVSIRPVAAPALADWAVMACAAGSYAILLVGSMWVRRRRS